MKYSDLSRSVLDSNKISTDDEKRFIKELRLCLRLDYEMSATEVRKLNDNDVIETWYSINSRPENRISGQ
jgi:hypothetical protein